MDFSDKAETKDETIVSGQFDNARSCPKCGVAVPPELDKCPNDGTELTATPQAELANRYEFLEPIGQGGMSVVYKARHKLMGTLVAIKLLQDKLTGNAAYVKRFQIEAQAAGRLDHRNVIKVHDFGVLESGFTYLVMDFVAGESLAEILHSEGPVDPDRALPIFQQVCGGLAHAHSKGILHRDLKPSNVIITREFDFERAKIVDFGIAKVTTQEGEYDPKLTATGEVFGSPNYMSPEQCTGTAVDKRSDIYSMGCLMYEVLTGRLPFAGSNVFETIHKQVNEAPEPIKTHIKDPRLDQLSVVVMRALQKDREARYQSFEEMLADLNHISEGGKVRQKMPLPPLFPLAAGLLVVSILIGGIIYNLRPSPSHTVAPEPVSGIEAIAPTDDGLGEMERIHIKTAFRNYFLTNELRGRSLHLRDTNMALAATNKKAMKLDLQDNPEITSKGLAEFALHPTLEKLELDGTSVDNEALTSIATISNLGFLSLGNTNVTADGFQSLAKMHNLRELWLEDLDLSDADLDKLPVMPQIKRIKFDENKRLTNRSVATIVEKFPNTIMLTMRYTNIDDQALPDLLKLKSLHDLRVIGTKMTEASNEALESKHILVSWIDAPVAGTRRMRIGGEPNPEPTPSAPADTYVNKQATDEEVRQLAEIGTFRTINLMESDAVTSKGVQSLKGNKTLVYLKLSGTNVDNTAFDVFPTLTNLRDLELSRTQITSKGFDKLKGIKNLSTLWLADLALTDSDLQKLPEMPTLTTLKLDRNELSDSSIAIIRQKCPNLNALFLRYCRGITDGAIPEIFRFRHLKRIAITGVPLSARGIKELEDMNLQVYKTLQQARMADDSD